jgi:DNA/RNA-binding domain of Phe-tRNA-synthetase-like protein
MSLNLKSAIVLDVTPRRHSPELDLAAAAAIAAARNVDVSLPTLFTRANEIPAPQLLLELALRSNRLPQPDTLTGACNLASIRTRTAITIHDLDKVPGHPHLITTTGSELFHPLGGARPYRLPPQQWAVVAGGRVLTHLDSRIDARAHVTLQTRNVLLCAQGSNANLDDALRDACDAVVAFNGGRVKL